MINKTTKQIYTCSLCGYSWTSLINKEIDMCPACHNQESLHPLLQDEKSYLIEEKKIYYPVIQPDNILPCCENCSNHPANGGTGVCHCVLPYMNPGY